MEDEGPILVDVFYPLSLGIGRKDRCELAGLHTWKGVLGPNWCPFWGEPGF